MRFLPNRAENSSDLARSGVYPSCLVENVARNLEKSRIDSLWVGRASRVLEEEIQNRLSNIGFLKVGTRV